MHARAPGHAALGLAVSVLAATGARLAPVWTLRVLLAAAFVAPGLLSLTLGGVRPQYRSLWLLPMAAALLCVASWREWSLPRHWRPLLVLWALVLAVSWPIVALRELDFRPALLYSSIVTNGLAADPPAVWTHAVTTVALTQLLGILWFDWLLGRSWGTACGRSWERDVAAPLAVSAAVACAAALYQAWIDPTWLSFRVWVAAHRAPGTLLGANGLGMVAATWGPVTAGLLWRTHGRSPALAALTLGWLGVWASGSRTALATIVIATACLAWAVLRDSGWRAWRVLPAATAVTVLVVGLAWTARTVGPLERVWATLPSPNATDLQRFARDMWERDGYGSAAVAAIGRFPLAGVGVGTFDRLSTDVAYQLTGRRIPPDNAQNWWRQQAAELGVVGAAIALAWTAMLVWLIARGRAFGDQRVAAASVAGAMLGFGAASMLGVPAQNPPLTLSFWTLAFMLTALAAPRLLEPEPGVPLTRWTGVALWVIALSVTAVQLHDARHELRPPYRAMQVGLRYGYGFERGGVTPEGERYWWTTRHAVFVFRPDRRVLEFRAAPMHPDLTRSPVRVEVWLRNEKIIDRELREPAPIVVRVPVRETGRGVMIETRVSRLFRDETGRARGLRITVRSEGEMIVRARRR